MDYTLTLTEGDLKVLNDALIEQPFRVAMPIITKINEQIQEAHANAAADLDERQDQAQPD